MPLISVVMSTYREPEPYLRAAVDSILVQTVADFEFIIVADDPTNTTLLERYAREDKRIVLLKNRCNCGLVASLNRALGVAVGDYIARMDADDIAVPTRLEQQLAYLHQHNLDLVGASVVRIDEEGQSLGNSRPRTDSPAVVMASLRTAPCVPHPTWLVKRSVYTALCGYRDIPRCEDYDLLLRALRRGFRIGICPSALLYYRIVQRGISRSALLQQHIASRYLASQYTRLEQVTTAEIQALTARISPVQNARYRRAEELFYKAAAQKGWRRGRYLVASALASRHQWHRFYDVWRLRRMRR